MTWKDHTRHLQQLLEAVQISKGSKPFALPDDQGYALWTSMTCEAADRQRTVYLVGNGASASMASHMAADLAKNAYMHTEVFTDLSLLTAIANDISFEQVFAEPLRRRMVRGDMLVAISSSGNSPNILRAAETARELGAFVVTLTAMTQENALRRLGHLNFFIPAATYGMAESGHAAMLHFWMDQVATRRAHLAEKTGAEGTHG